MKRVRSGLNDSGFPIVVIAGVNLFLLLCLCVLLSNHRMPRYGAGVRPAESHFIMGRQDRAHTHLLTVLPGETPRVFLEDREIEGGLNGVESVLAGWDCASPSRVSVVLVCDEAAPAGALQKLADMVLCHGFSCSFAGRPAVD